MVLIRLGAGKLEGHLVSQDRAVSDADVCEGACVDKHGGTLQALHQVGLDGVLHQSSQGATGADIVASDGVAALRARHDHAAEALPHISQAGAEGQDGHALAGHRDVETSLAGVALLRGSVSNKDPAEVPVIDVQDTAPSDGIGVDVETGKATNLVLGKRVGVRLVNAQLLQPAEHYGGKGTLATLGGNQALV